MSVPFSTLHPGTPGMQPPLRCLVCGTADPEPEPSCRNGLDRRVGTAAGCPHCGRLAEACRRRRCFGSLDEEAMAQARLLVRLSRLARRLSMRLSAGGPGR